MQRRLEISEVILPQEMAGDDSSVIKIITVVAKARAIPRVFNRPSGTLHFLLSRRGASNRTWTARAGRSEKYARIPRGDLAGDGKVAREADAGMSKETVRKVSQAAKRIPAGNECSKFRFNYDAFLRSA